MSAIEDVRQVIQDLLAPQLKSLDVRLTSLDTRLTNFETAVTQRFASAENVAAARHEALEAKISQLANMTASSISQLANTVSSNHASVLQKLDLERRVERTEFAQSAQSGYGATPYRALGTAIPDTQHKDE